MRKNKLTELIIRMQSGDEQAFDEIYQEFYNPFFYIALEMTRSEADADDIVQNTFIQLHKSISTLQDTNVFIIWLKRILLNKCRNFYRDRKNTIYNDDLIKVKSHETKRCVDITLKEVRFNSSSEILHDLIAELNYAQKEVITLYYFDQLKIREIANILKISEGTVKSRINTAKINLRKVCERYERDNHEKVSMHSWNMGFVLSGMYGTLYMTTPWKKIKFQAQSIGPSFGTSSFVASTGLFACTTTAVLAGSYLMGESRKETNVLPKQVQKENVEGDLSAYVKLRTWAHCMEEMQLKTKEEFHQVIPVYESLKEHSGVYWEALQKDQWAQNFLIIYTNKK